MFRFPSLFVGLLHKLFTHSFLFGLSFSFKSGLPVFACLEVVIITKCRIYSFCCRPSKVELTSRLSLAPSALTLGVDMSKCGAPCAKRLPSSRNIIRCIARLSPISGIRMRSPIVLRCHANNSRMNCECARLGHVTSSKPERSIQVMCSMSDCSTDAAVRGANTEAAKSLR